MMDALLGLLPTYGAWGLVVVVMLASIGLPVPASLALIIAGGLIAAGDLTAGPILAAALGGAVLGDTCGYLIGRLGLRQFSKPSDLRAQALIEQWGGPAVFFSRWLITPLGPAVNVAAGAAGLRPAVYYFGEIAGEMIWVLGYVLAGYLLADQTVLLVPVISNSAALLVALLCAAVLIFVLRRKLARTA